MAEGEGTLAEADTSIDGTYVGAVDTSDMTGVPVFDDRSSMLIENGRLQALDATLVTGSLCPGSRWTWTMTIADAPMFTVEPPRTAAVSGSWLLEVEGDDCQPGRDIDEFDGTVQPVSATVTVRGERAEVTVEWVTVDTDPMSIVLTRQ
ncbi:MAG: hypothetical protein AAGG08_03970 [Actinomycetota bacterium]